VREQLPLTGGALAAIAIVLAITVGGYLGVVAPRAREVARLQAQLSSTLTRTPGAGPVEPVTDAERARWREVDALVRARFVPPDDQLRVVLDVGRIARAAAVNVTDLRLENAAPGPTGGGGPAQDVILPSGVPSTLAINPGIISLSARHRYSELIDFLDRLARGNRYVAVQSLDVRRVEDHLESEIRLASLRWTAP
jgi:hypothetical protein